MVDHLQRLKNSVRNLSPADMTELIEHWLRMKDARFVFSLEWKPFTKVDKEGTEDFIRMKI